MARHCQVLMHYGTRFRICWLAPDEFRAGATKAKALKALTRAVANAILNKPLPAVIPQKDYK
jgi:hypothetical protein